MVDGGRKAKRDEARVDGMGIIIISTDSADGYIKLCGFRHKFIRQIEDQEKN